MTFRTKQDKINRKEANRRYYKLEENKQQKRDYMKEYSKRDYVKTKKHEYYVQNKLRWYVEKPKWGGKREEKTFYSLYGDVFSWFCLLTTGLIAIVSRRK